MSTQLIYPTKSELVDAAADQLIGAISDAISARGVALIVLTGGSNGIALLETLRARSSEVDWSRVELFFGDDRFVPADDPERNVGQAAAALLNHIGIDPARVHAMAPSNGEFGDDIDAAADAYAADLARVTLGEAAPRFDVHLLGMGGEGHINSLFPHTAATAETAKAVVAVNDSPKPPSRRITLTLPAVNRSRQVWFLVAGADKADAVAAGINGAAAADWPCAGAHGTEQTVWFLDEDAASKVGSV
ncbi:6-phosphogluconolactonase [Gordonia effusa NBRC 100432]|uniref:6-phosphogluconolactonase n=1 Tax=Gordonia effusa NBRC 100432 TaxID=1077974 RepID=H0QZE1_9ACTN|nr:6-phosphogluconolactonase [Gordonia effusa]GAB18192.1 6-phosphogluconolactonase [Gordonia effusa NBRC 100432]